MKRLTLTALQRFRRDERGLVTHFAVVVMLLILLFSGLSLDSTNAWRVKHILQTAADASAHAAVMDLPDENVAMDSALELAAANLGSGSNSTAIVANDVEFGSWDTDTRTFTASLEPTNAVRVSAHRSGANSNALPTFFLWLAGLESWNIEVQSVAFRSSVSCSVAEISANGVVQFAEDNDFYNGFCVESSQGVTLDDDNQFDDDNKIYVPSLSDISFLNSDNMWTIVGRGTSSSSTSLAYSDIIKTKSDISPPYVADIETLADNFLDLFYDGQPSYINTSSAVIQVDADDVKYTSFTPGRIYNINCGGAAGDTAQFFQDAEVRQVVIVSQCKILLGQDATFEDVVLVSRDTSSQSVYAASDVRLGDDDSCSPGGGVSIYTAGDFSSDSDLEVFGGYFSAKGSVLIKAHSGKIEGISVYANGNVTFTEKADFGLCLGTSDDNSVVSFYLVK